MGDSQVRELERRAQSTNDPADRLRWVAARLRAGETLEDLAPQDGGLILLDRVARGELTLERVRLAAYAGSPQARAAITDEGFSVPAALNEWARGLTRWPGASQRVAVALSRAAWSVIEHEEEFRTIIGQFEGLILLAEKCAASPDRRHADALDVAARRALDTRLELEEPLSGVGGEAHSALVGLVWSAKSDDPIHTLSEAWKFFSLWGSAPDQRSIAEKALRAWTLDPPPPAPIVRELQYSPNESYQRGDVIHHAVFGRGEVSHVRGTLLEVTFPGGSKKLAHRTPQ
jgi:hypothetical protein